MNKLPKYLLDNNICIYILRGQRGIYEQLKKIGWHNCCISETTVAELLYSAECSNSVSENTGEVLPFCADVKVMPVGVALSEYASQEVRLRRRGALINDIGLFISATAVVIDTVVMTGSAKHLSRVESIRIGSWAPRK